MEKVVSYLRVSTARQGESGLGLEAQRAAVRAHVNGATILAEFVEIESGSKNDRPQLAAALAWCKMTDATLIVARLDRLSRDAHFLIGLQRAGVPFRAADAPHVDAMTVGILALVAQKEKELISARTKAALAACKARGVVLGGFHGALPPPGLGAAANAQAANEYAAMVAPLIRTAMAEGKSLRRVAAEMSAAGIRTQRGGAWSAESVRSVWQRIQGREGEGMTG